MWEALTQITSIMTWCEEIFHEISVMAACIYLNLASIHKEPLSHLVKLRGSLVEKAERSKNAQLVWMSAALGGSGQWKSRTVENISEL